MPGRKTITTIRMMVRVKSRRMKIVGAAMEPRCRNASPNRLRLRHFGSRGRTLRELFRESTNVRNQGLDLIGFHALAVSRHLVLAFLDNACQFVVALLGDLWIAKAPNLCILARRRVALSVRSMARGTLLFVKCRALIIGPGRSTEHTDCSQDSCAERKPHGPVPSGHCSRPVMESHGNKTRSVLYWRYT